MKQTVVRMFEICKYPYPATEIVIDDKSIIVSSVYEAEKIMQTMKKYIKHCKDNNLPKDQRFTYPFIKAPELNREMTFEERHPNVAIPKG